MAVQFKSKISMSWNVQIWNAMNVNRKSIFLKDECIDTFLSHQC